MARSVCAEANNLIVENIVETNKAANVLKTKVTTSVEEHTIDTIIDAHDRHHKKLFTLLDLRDIWRDKTSIAKIRELKLQKPDIRTGAVMTRQERMWIALIEIELLILIGGFLSTQVYRVIFMNVQTKIRNVGWPIPDAPEACRPNCWGTITDDSTSWRNISNQAGWNTLSARPRASALGISYELLLRELMVVRFGGGRQHSEMTKTFFHIC